MDFHFPDEHVRRSVYPDFGNAEGKYCTVRPGPTLPLPETCHSCFQEFGERRATHPAAGARCPESHEHSGRIEAAASPTSDYRKGSPHSRGPGPPDTYLRATPQLGAPTSCLPPSLFLPSPEAGGGALRPCAGADAGRPHIRTGIFLESRCFPPGGGGHTAAAQTPV